MNHLRCLGIHDHPEWLPRYNIAPTQIAWVVALNDQGIPELRQMRWGLVPFWSKDPSIGARLINARSETARTKPAFRHCFKRRRCLVLADGFFEWQKTGKIKTPMYIRRMEGEQFVFAGLWDQWSAPDSELESFSILTTEANTLLRPIHDRMPVILKEEDHAAWLQPQTSPELLQSLLRPFPDEHMEFFPVSTLVNSPRNDHPDCVKPCLSNNLELPL